MPRTRTLTDVPEAEVEQLVDDFRSEGAIAERTRQRSGLWTVSATFRDRGDTAALEQEATMERTLTDIGDDDVDQLEEDFRSEGGRVTRARQRNGLWTVTVTFPDPGRGAATLAPTVAAAPAPVLALEEEAAPTLVVAAVAPSREGMVFPMHQRPADDYHVSPRRFGANRAGGRKHAGCDLYAPAGTEILAMADGQVIRGPYFFYEGTYALEVRHDDGMVLRYGEIKEAVPSGVEVGARVARGQVIAAVGLLNSGSSMLHLEMYRGTETGSLTQAGNEFKRRADLIDPTRFLDDAPLLSEAPREVADEHQPMDRWTAALLEVDTNGASATTAAQDSLAPGVGASRTMAATDLPRVVAIADRFVDVAAKFGLPAAMLAALASRESRCGKVLQDGWGDHGNAFGILQIDRRHHERIEGQPDPASVAHIEQAAGIIDDYLQQVMRKHPDWRDADLLKGAAVAYNAGVGNVQTVARMDLGTTGDDYGSDVIARAQYYFQHPELSAFRA